MQQNGGGYIAYRRGSDNQLSLGLMMCRKGMGSRAQPLICRSFGAIRQAPWQIDPKVAVVKKNAPLGQKIFQACQPYEVTTTRIFARNAHISVAFPFLHTDSGQCYLGTDNDIKREDYYLFSTFQ